MKCTVAENTSSVYFANLKTGDVFTMVGMKNTVLMRLDNVFDQDEDVFNAIDLEDGKLIYIGATDTVLKLKAEIHAEYA